MQIRSFFKYSAAAVILSIVCLAVAATPPKKPAKKAAEPGVASTGPHGIQFADITRSSGIRFVHNNGSFGKKYLPEALGPGCAFIDYDNDGYPDVLFVNGQDWPGHRLAASTLKLYHNNH